MCIYLFTERVIISEQIFSPWFSYCAMCYAVNSADESFEKLFVRNNNIAVDQREHIQKPDLEEASCNDDLVIGGQLCNGLQHGRMTNTSGDAACTVSGRTEDVAVGQLSSLIGSGCGNLDSNLFAAGGVRLDTPGMVECNKGEKKWNTSLRFLRPRIFCLEHCLEVEQLLAENGGANILLICHSGTPRSFYCKSFLEARLE